MRSAQEIKKSLETLFIGPLDDALISQFQYRRKGYIYQRQIGDVIQELNFEPEIAPKYDTSAECHIYPMLSFRIPKLMEKALILVAGNKESLAGGTYISNQPMGFYGGQKHKGWFTYQAADYAHIVPDIKAFYQKHCDPLLGQLSTVSDFLRIHQQGDEYFIKQNHWYIYVIAAHLLENDLKQAEAVFRERFNKPGVRRLYAAFVEYFERIVQ